MHLKQESRLRCKEADHDFLSGQHAVDCRQGSRELGEFADQRIAAVTEQGRKIGIGFAIDRDRKDVDALGARFADGAARIFQRKTPFIMIDVVRLAVGQKKQEFLRLGWSASFDAPWRMAAPMRV